MQTFLGKSATVARSAVSSSFDCVGSRIGFRHRRYNLLQRPLQDWTKFSRDDPYDKQCP
jgi:hypothetical protein